MVQNFLARSGLKDSYLAGLAILAPMIYTIGGMSANVLRFPADCPVPFDMLVERNKENPSHWGPIRAHCLHRMTPALAEELILASGARGIEPRREVNLERTIQLN